MVVHALQSNRSPYTHTYFNYALISSPGIWELVSIWRVLKMVMSVKGSYFKRCNTRCGLDMKITFPGGFYGTFSVGSKGDN